MLWNGLDSTHGKLGAAPTLSPGRQQPHCSQLSPRLVPGLPSWEDLLEEHISEAARDLDPNGEPVCLLRGLLLVQNNCVGRAFKIGRAHV